MEFFDSFCWAVPRAFSDALGSCCFEAGDVLYSSPNAYAPRQSDSSPSDFGLQVTFPARSAGSKAMENQASVFARNWESTVEVVFFKSEKAPLNVLVDGTKVTTTQGRLYNLLRTGDLELLTATANPPVPLLLDELKKRINQNDILEKIKQLLAVKKPGTIAGVMAYDATDGVAADKSQVIMEALNGIQTSVLDIAVTDFPSLSPLELLPTAKVRIFALPEKQLAECRSRLVAALWPRRDGKAATKSFCDVVERTRSVSSNSFKLSNHIKLLDPKSDKLKTISEVEIPKSLSNFLKRTKMDLPKHLFTSENLLVSDLAFKVTAQNESKLDQTLAQTHTSGKHILAVDLPLWIESEELKNYEGTFGSQETLTGKIGILRREGTGKIGVWVRAGEVVNHSCLTKQAFVLAVMLATRTGLKLSAFQCGYFTKDESYQFAPEMAQFDLCLPKGPIGIVSGNP